MNIQCIPVALGPCDFAIKTRTREDGRIEQCIGGCKVIRIGELFRANRMVDCAQIGGNSYSRSMATLSHIGNVVEIKNGLVGGLSHAEKLKRHLKGRHPVLRATKIQSG